MSRRPSGEDKYFYYRMSQRVTSIMYEKFSEVLNASLLDGKRHLTRERFYKSALAHGVITQEEYDRMKFVMRGRWRKKLPEQPRGSF